jgi:hypothetical protein
MRTMILSALLLAGALVAPAQAAPTCLIEVNGKRLFDGSCDAFRLDNGGVFMGDRKSVSALVRPRLGSSDDAIGAYKVNGMVHDLDYLKRDGPSCWRGSGARFCAWGAR